MDQNYYRSLLIYVLNKDNKIGHILLQIATPVKGNSRYIVLLPKKPEKSISLGQNIKLFFITNRVYQIL